MSYYCNLCHILFSLFCMCVLGTCPNALRGSNTGVFVGCSSSEAHQAWTDIDKCTGYEMTGCTHTMFANRLSYFFDFKGTF